MWTAAGLLAGCSGGGGATGQTPETTEADVGVSTLRTYGEPCAANAECETGLCVIGEYAGFGWCTATCTEEAEPCPADSTGNIGGWCARMPDEYPGEVKQFCLPLCKTIFECNGLTDLWETCEPPTYKGNLLYGSATGITVCQAPSARGKEIIDPKTCEGWTVNFQEFQPQIGVCKAYCEYLVTCKEVAEPVIYNKECCAYGCMLQMTPDGVVDNIYEKKKKCYQQNFFSYQGTPKVCTAPVEDCGKSPEDPSPR